MKPSPKGKVAGQTRSSQQLAGRSSVLRLVVDTTENLIREGQLVSLSDIQDLMGWATPEDVLAALTEHRIFALALSSEWYFPAFFADADLNLEHLEAASKALGDLPGGAKLQFLVSPKASLGGGTQLEAIAAGRLDEVLQSARAYAES